MRDDTRQIDGFPGYVVARDGTVWSQRDFKGGLTAEWHRLSPRPDRDGYLSVTLQHKGERRTVKVAHLVLTAFVGPRPAGGEACHWPDPDPANNAADNLRWGTHRENIADKVRASRQAKGSGHAAAKLTEADVLEIRFLFDSGGVTNRALAARFGVSPNQIGLIVKRKNWAHV